MDSSSPILKFFSLEPLDFPLALVAMVLFFLFYKALEKLLFRPFLSYLDARDAVTEGARHKAHDNILKAQKLDKEFEDRLFAARLEANKERELKLKEVEKEVQTILEGAAQAEHKISEGAQAQLARELSAARQRIAQEVGTLSESLAKQVKSSLGVH